MTRCHTIGRNKKYRRNKMKKKKDVKFPLTVRLNLERRVESEFDTVKITEELLAKHPDLKKHVDKADWYKVIDYVQSHAFESEHESDEFVENYADLLDADCFQIYEVLD